MSTTTTSFVRIVDFIAEGKSGNKFYLVSLLDQEGNDSGNFRCMKQSTNSNGIEYQFVRIAGMAATCGKNNPHFVVPDRMFIHKDYVFEMMEYLPINYSDILGQISDLKQLIDTNTKNDPLAEDYEKYYEEEHSDDEEEPEPCETDLVVEGKGADREETKSVDAVEKEEEAAPIDELIFENGSVIVFEHEPIREDNILVRCNAFREEEHLDEACTQTELDDIHAKDWDDLKSSLLNTYKLRTKNGFSETQFVKFFKLVAEQFLTSLKHLQKDFGYVHGNIKPENILVRLVAGSEDNLHRIEFVFSDWGNVKHLHNPVDLDYIPHYQTAPPEVFFEQPLVAQSFDIWSIGILLGDLMMPMQKFFPAEGEGEGEDQDEDDDDDSGAEEVDDEELAKEEAEADAALDEENAQVTKVATPTTLAPATTATITKSTDDGETEEVAAADDDDVAANKDELRGWGALTVEETDWFEDWLEARGLIQWIDKDGKNLDDEIPEKEHNDDEDDEEDEVDSDSDVDDINLQEQKRQTKKQKIDPTIAEDHTPIEERFKYVSLHPSNLAQFVTHIQKRRNGYGVNFPNYLMQIWLNLLIADPSLRPSAASSLQQLQTQTKTSWPKRLPNAVPIENEPTQQLKYELHNPFSWTKGYWNAKCTMSDLMNYKLGTALPFLDHADDRASLVLVRDQIVPLMIEFKSQLAPTNAMLLQTAQLYGKLLHENSYQHKSLANCLFLMDRVINSANLGPEAGFSEEERLSLTDTLIALQGRIDSEDNLIQLIYICMYTFGRFKAAVPEISRPEVKELINVFGKEVNFFELWEQMVYFYMAHIVLKMNMDAMANVSVASVVAFAYQAAGCYVNETFVPEKTQSDELGQFFRGIAGAESNIFGDEDEQARSINWLQIAQKQ